MQKKYQEEKENMELIKGAIKDIEKMNDTKEINKKEEVFLKVKEKIEKIRV